MSYGKLVSNMKIDEAIANLRKQINCECELYCRNYCSQCEDYVSQTQYIASMEKVIEYIEGRINGEKDKRPAD